MTQFDPSQPGREMDGAEVGVAPKPPFIALMDDTCRAINEQRTRIRKLTSSLGRAADDVFGVENAGPADDGDTTKGPEDLSNRIRHELSMLEIAINTAEREFGRLMGRMQGSPDERTVAP